MADYRTFLRDYRTYTTPDDVRLDKLRAGMAPMRPRPISVLLVSLPFVAMAAAFALAVTSRPPAAWNLTDAGAVTLLDTVRVDARGKGSAEVTGHRVDVDWQQGVLGVEVERGRGVDLHVYTDEASVRVVGTGFTVTRDALGTTVDVKHGRVEVDCAFGGPSELAAGAARTCLPRTALGAIGRIRAIETAGAPPAAMLAEVEAAMTRPDLGDAAANELGALRVGALLELGREDEALAAAESTLRASAGARDEALRRIAARLHVARGACDAALPHLRSLAEDELLAEDRVLLDHCAPGKTGGGAP